MGGEAGVSVLGPAAKKWREDAADEAPELLLGNTGLKPGNTAWSQDLAYS